MKKLAKFTILAVMLLFMNIAYSQKQILDYFNKDKAFLERYCEKLPNQDVNGLIIYRKNFDGTDVYFSYEIKRNRCTSIFIPYTTEADRKLLEKTISSTSKKSKTGYYLRSELDNYLIEAYFDKKNKLLIFY